MNNLQLALAVLGAVVLAAVVAHGAWTSRKSRPKQADSEAAQPPPPPMDFSLPVAADARSREPSGELAASVEGFQSLSLIHI